MELALLLPRLALRGKHTQRWPKCCQHVVQIRSNEPYEYKPVARFSIVPLHVQIQVEKDARKAKQTIHES